jgi:hypothetical protein
LEARVDNNTLDNKGTSADAPITHPPTLIWGRSRTKMKGNAGQNSGMPSSSAQLAILTLKSRESEDV